MTRWFLVILAMGLMVRASAAPVMAGEIRGKSVSFSHASQSAQILEIPLEQYWRGNLKVVADRLTANKHDYPHVPNLIEYRVDLSEGGGFEVQARYSLNERAPAQLSVDGRSLAAVFEMPQTNEAEWKTLGEVRLRPGPHTLRFTSRTVDTGFPDLVGLRLRFLGGDPPEPESAPPIVGPRTTLPADWSASISRKIHQDFHTAGFIDGVGKRFDGKEYGDTLVRSHVNSICVFAKCHHGYAYYDTRIGTRHPGLDFDLLAGQIKACRERKIAIWAYFSLGYDELYTSTIPTAVLKPDERDTKIEADTKSHYVRDYIWPMIDEVVRGYDLDGLFFDFPGDESFVAQTIERIKAIKPGLVVAFNHQWNRSREELRQLGLLEIEGWRHKQPLYHWQYFARYARGAVPLTAMTIRFWKSWQDFGGIADEQMLRFQVATGLANGCLLTIGDHPNPSCRLDPVVYERIGHVFGEAEALEPYVTGSQSVPYVALWREQRVELVAADWPCHALLDAGLHFDVIDSTQPVGPYAAIVIADGSKPDAGYVEQLSRYVQDGGRLLVFGRPATELAQLLGVRVTDRAETAYLRVDASVFPSAPATDLYTYLPMWASEPVNGTRRLAPVVWAMNHGTIHRSKRQSPPAVDASELSAITLRTVGKGVVAYCGAPLLETYARLGYTPMRQILSDLLHQMIPPDNRTADVRSPVPLEVSVNRLGERLIIHLVHCPLSRRTASSMDEEDYVNHDPIIDGPVLVDGVEVRVPSLLLLDRRLHLVRPEKGELSVRKDGSITSIGLPAFSIHAVIVAE